MALSSKELKEISWRGSYRGHRAAVTQAAQRAFPRLEQIGAEHKYWRCLNADALSKILEYCAENKDEYENAWHMRYLVGRLGNSRKRGLPRSGALASAVIVSGGALYLMVVVLDIKRDENGRILNSCVSANLSARVINPDTCRFVDLPSEVSGKMLWSGVLQTAAAEQYKDSEDDVVEEVQSEGHLVDFNLVRTAARNMMPDLELHRLDKQVVCVPRATFQRAAEFDRTDASLYKAEVNDCDDFAFAFRTAMSRLGVTSVAVVIDYSSSHAYNAVALLPDNGKPLTEDNLPSIILFEPQSDKSPDVGDQHYLAERGLMIW